MRKSAAQRSDKPDLNSVRRDVDWQSSKQKGICPLCHKRKLSVSAGRDVEVVAKCWGGCNQAEVAAALGLSGGEPRTGAKLKHKSTSDQRYEEYCRFRDALAIFRRACDYSDQPRAYFQSRSIDKCPPTARLLPASETRTLTSIRPDRFGRALFSKQAPVMVLPIITSDGRFQGVHTTALKLEGNGKLNDNARRIFGLKKGGYIPLDIDEIDPAAPLIVGEGVETSASAMQIAGLQGVAAIDAGNFASVNLPPCSELIIARDRGKAGGKAAEILAQRYAARLIVRIAVPPKVFADWNDAHQAAIKGGDVDVLKRSILHARIYEEVGASEGFARTMEEMMALEVPPRPYLLKPWLTARGSGQIHAMRGVGKTRFALSVAYAVATGKPLLDWTVEQRTRVLYVDAELDLDDLKGRLRALGPKAENLRVISFDDLFNRGADLPDLGKPEGRAFFDREFDLFEPGLVVLDSITFLAKVAENEAEAWDPIADWIVSHRRRGRTILFVHHQGRSGKARGTTKREDGIEVSVGLKARDDLADDDCSAFELVFDKHRGFFGADAAPRIMRYSQTSDGIDWSYETKCENIKSRVSELFNEGYKQVDIAKELHITKGRVSQIVKELR